MVLNAFPYVGGKTYLAGWIVDRIPEHSVYVEPFGGSASVLLNKPRSEIEVYNDLDRDVVQLFDVVRERPGDLAAWVERTPYSEELHERFATAFYAGERPDDPIERAGRFLYLRHSQWGAKYKRKSGFRRASASARGGGADVWRQVPERIRDVCGRLQGVEIQNADYRDVIERYDGPETVFYADPPYLDKDCYRVEGFDHGDLADALGDLEGSALVSYADQPAGLYDDWTTVERSWGHDAGNTDDADAKGVTERLICNFDPRETSGFTDSLQQRIPVAAGAENDQDPDGQDDRPKSRPP